MNKKKTRSNTAAAILSNTKDLEEALLAAQEAEGSALRENEKYLDSIQGKMDQFNNAIQTMWSNTLDDDMVKGVVELGTELVKIVDNFGLIKTLVMAIGTFLIQKNFKGDLFGGLFSTQNIEEVRVKLQSLKTEYEKAQQAYDTNHTNANKRYLDNTKKTYEKYNAKISPQLEEYDKLINKRQALTNELSDAQLHEEFQTKRLAAGYDDAAASVDNARNNVARIKGEIAQTESAIKNVEKQLQQSGVAGATAGQKIKAGFKAAKAEIVKFGKQMLSSMAYMYVFATILELFTKLGHMIEDLVDNIAESPEEAQEAFEELNNELSKTKTEIRNLEEELESANKRMDELIDKGSLTFVEQEELNKLKATTQELKSQIALQETLKNSQQQGVNAASINSTDKYLNTSFMSDKTKSERQEEAKETGNTIGTIAGGIIGATLIALGVLGEGVTFGASTGLIVLGASMFSGGAIGGAIGSGIAGAAYDSEQSVSEAMNDMLNTREQLKKNQNDALLKKDSEAYNEATTALRTYDDQMAKHISQIQENYNAMDWEVASPEDRKKMIEYADWLSTYSISMKTNGAKNSAIERIFGDEASDKVKALKANIDAAVNAAKANDTDLLFDFHEALNSEDLDEFRKRLYNMGLTITDVEYYFQDLIKAEKEAEDSYTTYETVKQINSLSGSIKSLKEAFGEITEEGYVSTETLVSLEEAFGGLGSSWDNFVNTVATGTGSIKDATNAINELLEAYLFEKMSGGKLTAEEQLKTILLLQQLGVKNAKEYVDAMQKASTVKTIATNIVADKDNAKTKEQHIEEIEKLYGVTLTDDEKRLLIEKAITAENAKQAEIAASKQQGEYDAAIYNKKIAEDALSEAKKQLDDLKAGEARKVSSVGKKYQRNGAVYWEYDGRYYTNGDAEVSHVDNNAIYNAEKAVKAAQSKVDEIKIPAEIDVDAAKKTLEDANNELQDAFNSVGLSVEMDFEDFDTKVDKVQDAYTSIKNIATEYNTQGYLSLDNLQALLNLLNMSPEYLACLQMENGQLTINQAALQSMLETKLDDAKATAVQTAITQLNALAERKQAIEISNSAVAANQASIELGTYSGALGTVAQDAIVAAGSVAAFNAALQGAQGNSFANQDEIDQILANFNNSVELIDSVRNNLSSNFNNVLDPGSNTSGQDVAESEWERLNSKINYF